VKCRCGTRVAPGGTVFEITGVPPSLENLVRGTTFCSARCVRAFCLESLEMLDSLDSPDAKAAASDLHELALEVATDLVSILGE
jgi:hypothetical protein